MWAWQGFLLVSLWQELANRGLRKSICWKLLSKYVRESTVLVKVFQCVDLKKPCFANCCLSKTSRNPGQTHKFKIAELLCVVLCVYMLATDKSYSYLQCHIKVGNPPWTPASDITTGRGRVIRWLNGAHLILFTTHQARAVIRWITHWEVTQVY